MKLSLNFQEIEAYTFLNPNFIPWGLGCTEKGLGARYPGAGALSRTKKVEIQDSLRRSTGNDKRAAWSAMSSV